MSTLTLRTEIAEDYLTCPICFTEYCKPKALPCIHTFCESCLRDYTAGRGFETEGSFPCPTCRATTKMPGEGVSGFPDNHVMSSLSNTIDKARSRPVPKPRRSLGQSQIDLPVNVPSEVTTTNGPDDFEMVTNDAEDTYTPLNHVNKGSIDDSSQYSELLPPYSSVSDTAPDHNTEGAGVSASSSGYHEIDPNWMVVPQEAPPLPDKGKCCEMDRSPPPGYYDQNSQQPIATIPPHHPTQAFYRPNGTDVPVAQGEGSSVDPPPIGWHIPAHGDSFSRFGVPRGVQTFNTHDPPPRTQSQTTNHVVAYPSVPQNVDTLSTVCSENLMLYFGKLGSSAGDFLKPVGLAVSKEGHYIISDSGGDTNRIFIYNSGGEILTAFRSGCDVRDVTVTHSGDILAAVHKNMCAIRHFTMQGKLKAEYGKFFTFENPSGIVQLKNGGAVVSGTEGNCVYILTDQMKLSKKFGRKGNGDGYFMQPSHIAVNSKDNIIVSDHLNCNIQVFTPDGKFKHRFGTKGVKPGQLNGPLGVCVDKNNNIIVADSNNHRVEVFSPKGRWLSTVVKNTSLLGEKVRPVNVAVTPTAKVAVLLQGPYFAEVRVYSSKHYSIPTDVDV